MLGAGYPATRAGRSSNTNPGQETRRGFCFYSPGITKDVMPIKQSLHKGLVPVHIYTNDIDHSAIQQLLNISNLPIVHPHVAAMPDVHAGIGATVGSVIPTRGAIIPAAVGVDIGCSSYIYLLPS